MGHIVIGTMMVKRAIDGISDFPGSLMLRLLRLGGHFPRFGLTNQSLDDLRYDLLERIGGFVVVHQDMPLGSAFPTHPFPDLAGIGPLRSIH